MRIGTTKKGAEMFKRGYLAYVEWNDKSRSYYKTKKIALSEMRKEIGKRCRLLRKQ